MKKIFIFFIIIVSFSLIFSLEYKNSNLDIKYLGNVSSEGEWGYYAANNKSGPYFIDNDNCVYIDDSNQLILYSIKSKKDIIIEKTNGDLNKIGNSIYLKKNNDYYIFKDLKLNKVSSEIYLFDSYYYSDTDGIFIKKNNKKEVLVPNIKNNQSEYYFVKGPIYDGINLYYLSINAQSSLTYNLIKYDIKEKKEIFLQEVRSFAILNSNKDYILTNAIGGKYTYKKEFADDFYIISKNTGHIIYNFDEIIFKKSEEITIITFDINENNKIIAFGAYSKFKNTNNSPSRLSSERPVIVLELIAFDKIKQIKINYYVPSIPNLRFRETPNLDGKFIRLLVKGEKLELLERGKEETINGINGNWLKLKTEKNEIGWAFSGYLEEVK